MRRRSTAVPPSGDLGLAITAAAAVAMFLVVIGLAAAQSGLGRPAQRELLPKVSVAPPQVRELQPAWYRPVGGAQGGEQRARPIRQCFAEDRSLRSIGFSERARGGCGAHGICWAVMRQKEAEGVLGQSICSASCETGQGECLSGCSAPVRVLY